MSVSMDSLDELAEEVRKMNEMSKLMYGSDDEDVGGDDVYESFNIPETRDPWDDGDFPDDEAPEEEVDDFKVVVSDEDSDDESQPPQREVFAENNALDHIVVGCSDLYEAMDDFEKMTGTRPVMVVSHNGVGTKSARVSFDDCQFLEILGPDPKNMKMPLAQELLKIPSHQLVPFHYAIRQNNASELKKTEWKELGYVCDHITMYGKDPGRGLWKWDCVYLGNHDAGGLVPFFIQWGDSTHACEKLPVVGKLERVTVEAPPDSSVHALLQHTKELDLIKGASSKLEFVFSSPKGCHVYACRAPVGISFPRETDGSLMG